MAEEESTAIMGGGSDARVMAVGEWAPEGLDFLNRLREGVAGEVR